MNAKIQELANQAGFHFDEYNHASMRKAEVFAELIVQTCIDKIETYQIPVGNSRSGELACEWTYSALREIRDDIREVFKPV